MCCWGDWHRENSTFGCSSWCEKVRNYSLSFSLHPTQTRIYPSPSSSKTYCSSWVNALFRQSSQRSPWFPQPVFREQISHSWRSGPCGRKWGPGKWIPHVSVWFWVLLYHLAIANATHHRLSMSFWCYRSPSVCSSTAKVRPSYWLFLWRRPTSES